MPEPNVLIIGGGVAGLTAALELARFGVCSDVVEAAPFAGGHAIGFSCKATSVCVKCGACLAEDRLHNVLEAQEVHLYCSSRVLEVTRAKGAFSATVLCSPLFVDPGLCTGCGRCLEACPVDGAVLRGPSPYNRPPFAVNPDLCVRRAGKDCRACINACPESAVSFNQKEEQLELDPDAVILATGFHAFDPGGGPYGYGEFDDVITNLDLEHMLREHGRLIRPSDGSAPKSIAFIQCVGSRDERLGHLWCSRVCCGSALRTAQLLRHQDPGIEVTVFYIDIQTFGRDFESSWKDLRERFRFIRAVPADAIVARDRSIRLSCFDPEAGLPDTLDVELLVLSVGITPGPDLSETAGLFGLSTGPDGFLAGPTPESQSAAGVAAAGTVLGPMSIPDSVKSGKAAAWRTLEFLGPNSGDTILNSITHNAKQK